LPRTRLDQPHRRTDPGVRFDRPGPFVGRPLRNLWSRFEAEVLERIVADHPTITPTSNRLMAMIDAEGTQIGELARRAGVAKQSMAEAVQSLEAQGLVRREPDPRDRRAKRVVLTDDGWIGLRTGRDAAEAVHRRWTEVLGERDMARLVQLLEKLDARLRE
jgi:DNA-binding MarR family transcriptional regulator